MRRLAISLLAAGVLALPVAPVLGDDDDDDRGGRWHEGIDHGYWYPPPYHPWRFHDGYGPPYGYDEHFGYPPWHAYPPPTWHSPWEYDRPSYEYWRWHPHPPFDRHVPQWQRRHGDDDDDDDDDDD